MDSDYLDLSLHDDSILSKNDNILSTDVELFFQEIELAIKMEPTDVYAHYNTFSLQNYVFSRQISETDIIAEITEHIKNNCYHSYLFTWNVNVIIEQKIMVIEFNVYGAKPSEKWKKTFLLQT